MHQSIRNGTNYPKNREVESWTHETVSCIRSRFPQKAVLFFLNCICFPFTFYGNECVSMNVGFPVSIWSDRIGTSQSITKSFANFEGILEICIWDTHVESRWWVRLQFRFHRNGGMRNLALPAFLPHITARTFAWWKDPFSKQICPFFRHQDCPYKQLQVFKEKIYIHNPPMEPAK